GLGRYLAGAAASAIAGSAGDASADAAAGMAPDLAPDERLFDALLDRDVPPEHLLPESGVGISRERYLSTAFITPNGGTDVFGGYGTRASTLVEARSDGRIRFTERSWNTPGAPAAGYRERDERFGFRAAPAAGSGR
ncbi:MAG: NRDE family protein, partial [Gemmatimonadales bacterium]|nr:NRDE family protein [Gemmatimonadales bacterium]